MDWNKIIATEGNSMEWKNGDFTCFIKRTGLGHWCGYVTIPPSYPEFDYDVIECHGGITFQEENDMGVTIGFDCAHSGDLTRLHTDNLTFIQLQFENSVYRDKEYVVDNVNNMVSQILKVRSIERHIKINNLIS